MTAAVGFTGATPLTRFTLRRDRIRIAVWITAVIVLVLVTVASVKGLFPNQEELDRAARTMQDNAAAIAFNGPAQGLDTVGGQVAFQTGTWGLILVGMMSMFMLGRLTRGEEEAGRSELLRSLPIGAHALPAAAMFTVAGMNLVTGVLVFASLVTLDLPATGSVVFALSFILFGLFMTAVTSVGAQITENTRVVYGIGGLVLGVSFVLRAIGDVGDGTLSWLSPIGWAQKTRPYAGERWWPFLVIVAATALLAWLAIELSRRRDLGAGLIAPRPGPAYASPSLGTPIGLATRLQRGSLVGWSVGVAALGFAYGSIADSLNDFIEDNEALADIIAAQGAGTLVEQYFAMSFRILAIIAAGFAIQSAMRIRSEETSTRAEPVLATQVSRVRFASSHLLLAFSGTVAILVLTGAAFGITAAAVTGDVDAIGQAIIGQIVFAPAVWLLVGLTFAAIGCAPRTAIAAWALLGGCFVVGFLGQLLDLPTWVQNLSPFQHVPQYPATGVSFLPLVLLGAIAAALTALGVAGLQRRDIG